MQIATFGGSPGIRDIGLLESAIMRPRQRFHYGEIQTITQVAVALNANHPFVDGNKRVSLHAMLIFMRLHGRVLTDTPEQVTVMVRLLAAGEIFETDFLAWVDQHSAALPGPPNLP